MKVILKDNIKGVGKKDEIINASDGYARNFLFPKNLAVEANAENMSKLKAKQNSTAFKKGQEKEEAQKIAEKMKIKEDTVKEYYKIAKKKLKVKFVENELDIREL